LVTKCPVNDQRAFSDVYYFPSDQHKHKLTLIDDDGVEEPLAADQLHLLLGQCVEFLTQDVSKSLSILSQLFLFKYL